MPSTGIANLKRPESFPACGRLIVMQGLDSESALADSMASTTRFADFFCLNFPAMPDAIELVRRADYTVSAPWGFPDGIHFYKGTAPLEIPFSFRLHAMDRLYCPGGAKQLLQVVAFMQALVLPVGPNSLQVSAGARRELSTNQTSQGHDAAESETGYANIPENVYPPVTCYLELILTERNSVGVACIGYVKEVRTKLNGPFMRGPGISRNLPTSADCDFVFVHHPGHSNSYGPSQYDTTEKQAYASTVNDNLYNTVGLLTNPQGFKSFNDADSTNVDKTQSPAATTATPTTPVPDGSNDNGVFDPRNRID